MAQGNFQGKLKGTAVKSVKVADYMATRLVTFHPETNVVEALGTLLKHSISGAPVVDADGKLVGVLSEVDVMQIVIQGSYYDESTGIVADFMKSPVDTVSPDDDIYNLAQRFLAERRRRFPVVKNGRLVGQISRRDVLRAAEDFLVNKPKKR
jgi:CBS domain-containing protein